jgi:hypothetical protein
MPGRFGLQNLTERTAHYWRMTVLIVEDSEAHSLRELRSGLNPHDGGTMRRFAIGLLLLVGGIGYTVASRASAQVPQAPKSQTSSFQAESWTNLPLTPNQPDKATYWSVEEMTRVHETLKARAAKGEPLNARSLMALPMTRTHGYTVGHRTSKDPVTADQHDGVTDVYFAVPQSPAATPSH